jgi:glycosyltransferase involved in cell wall biosynthesis
VRYGSARSETLAYTGNMVQAVKRPAGLWAAWSMGRAFRTAAREEMKTADLVHAHWWIPGGLAAPPELPLVLTVHGTDGAILGRSKIAAAIARPLFQRASVVTAVSESAAETIFRATGRKVDPSHIQPMPVDTSHYGAPSAGGGGLVVVARLTKQKRIDLAIRALLLTARRDLRLRIAGDGPERSALEALTRELGLEGRVTFLGTIPPVEIPTFLHDADVAIFPAVGEGFGLAAAEALMAGVPVVACTDGGGVLSVVPGTGEGRQVAPDPQAIAAAIDELMRDGASRAAAASAGKEWARVLSAENVAATCAGWYQEALRG